MNKLFIKTVAVLAAIAGSSILTSLRAEAASLVEFSYDFDNGLGAVSGTFEGDIDSDGTIANLANLNATYSSQAGSGADVIFDQFDSAPNPIVSIGTIEETTLFDKSVPHVLFTMANDEGDRFFANSIVTSQRAFLVSAETNTFIQDTDSFGTWIASAATDIPEPSVVLGLLAMAGCLAPTVCKRQSP